MRLKRHSRTLVALLVVAAALVTVAQDKFTTSLIPREVLFGNPERTNPQISPDGTQLGYLARPWTVFLISGSRQSARTMIAR